MYEFLYELTNTEFNEIKKLYQFNRIHINDINIGFYTEYLFNKNLSKIDFIYNKNTNIYMLYQKYELLDIYAYNMMQHKFTKIDKSNFILTADLSSKILKYNIENIIFELDLNDHIIYDIMDAIKYNNTKSFINIYKNTNIQQLLNGKQLYLEYFSTSKEINKQNIKNLQNIYMLINLRIILPKLQNIEMQYIKKQVDKIVIKLVKKINKQYKQKLYIVEPLMYDFYISNISIRYKLFVNLKEIAELFKFTLYTNIIKAL